MQILKRFLIIIVILFILFYLINQSTNTSNYNLHVQNIL